jgi:dTDP-4-dehydrorhamnose 3,5-epimerase
MRVTSTMIPGVLIVEPDVYRDARGYFLETFHASRFAAAGLPTSFVQDNHSSSVQHTLRGLHLQRRMPQGKLIRVVEGDIWDVAVDVRRGSPAFGRHVVTVLSAQALTQLYVPPGCAHGFQTLEDDALVLYFMTDFHQPELGRGVRWDDPTFGIPWPIRDPIILDRDRDYPDFHAAEAGG